MQGDDPNHIGRENISACLKHYMGYGVPFSRLDRTPAIINDRICAKNSLPVPGGIAQ